MNKGVLRFFLWIAGFSVAVTLGFVGGILFVRLSYAAAEAESSRRFQHFASQQVAEAYLVLMEAADNLDTNHIATLQHRARVAIEGYVQETRVFQTRYGSKWCPTAPEVFGRAEEYLVRHPKFTDKEGIK